MNENIIFFFSGTGNSFDITLRISKQIGNTDIFNIASNKDLPSLDKYKRIGLVFPIYGFTMPNIVSKFISNIPNNKIAYCFSIVTLGAFALGAMYRTYEAFEKIGIKLNYITNIYMPENYILFSRVPSDRLIKIHLKNSIKRINEISSDILNMDSRKPKKDIFYTMGQKFAAIESKKWALISSNFNINSDCIVCNKCIKTCPVENIEIVNYKIVFGHNCECCLACIHVCPKQAINYGSKTIGKKRYINPNIKIEDMKTY